MERKDTGSRRTDLPTDAHEASIRALLADPSKRDVLKADAVEVYSDALRVLRVPEEDVRRNALDFQSRALTSRRFAVVYSSNRAAQAIRVNNLGSVQPSEDQ